MPPNASPSTEYHSRFCALRSRSTALVFVLVSVTLAFLSWRELRRPFSASPGLFELLLGHLTAIAMLAQLMILLRCFRERLVLVLGIAEFAIGLLRGLLPDFAAPAASTIRAATFSLWLVASGVSFSMMWAAFAKSGKGT